MEKFEVLEKKMCMELEAIEQKLQSGNEMSETDLKRVDMLAHAMKSLATYKAMSESTEWEDNGVSGRHSRGMNGGYVSRDGGYADGYANGYSAAMSQQSGRWPYTGRW